MKAKHSKSIVPPQRATYTDEQLRKFTVEELYRRKLTDDEMNRLRAINESRIRETESKDAEWLKAERPLADELKAAGFEVESAWDLFNRNEPWNKKEHVRPYPAALPILLKHLERPYPDRVREGIARALAVRREGWSGTGIDVMRVWDTLTSLYRKEKAGTDAKHGLAVAIAALADDDVLNEVIDLAKDVSNGDSRLFFLSALERSRTAMAKSALMEFIDDPELGTEVRAVLRRTKK